MRAVAPSRRADGRPVARPADAYRSTSARSSPPAGTISGEDGRYDFYLLAPPVTDLCTFSFSVKPPAGYSFSSRRIPPADGVFKGCSVVVPNSDAPSGTDAVAAKVNGVPITAVDVDRSFLAQVQVPYSAVQDDPRAKELRRQVLDNLIDRELLLQRAKSLKMTVPPQQLDAQMQQLTQRFPSPEAFDQALKAQNFTLDAIKKARFPKPKKKPAQVTWPVTYKKR